MTNSKILLDINALKSEIDDQNNLCSNIFKLENVESQTVNELVTTTLDKIDKLKQYQTIITNRNNQILEFQQKKISAHSLIKMKEGLLLKKKLYTPLIQSPKQDDLIHLSLSAFQAVQEYKQLLGEIRNILNTFNNEEFNIGEYI